ncbi:MAG TPA: hypothetical protein PKA16_14545 [Ottowia sp.]|uniref:hypothetical protein n=1 Tax=Ottowia sp. TaxID=1898956 RepID=UPI002C6C29CB|nr:hypothetical protein [Ottowia sp.]HMN22597.1 hypothetical protein [Ottowia sp.]
MLLALLAQTLVMQASAGHAAAMLSERWVAGMVCTGSGEPTTLELGDAAAEGAQQLLARCPLCAVAAMPLLAPLPASDAVPVALGEYRPLRPLPPALLLAAPARLLPPAQGPPTAG